MSNRVLITGSKGFIGSAIAARFKRSGWEVVSYDKSEGMDVLDVEQLEQAIKDVNGVIHLAAILGTDKTVTDSTLAKSAIEVNIIGGFNVIELCTKHKKRLLTLDNGNWWMANTYSASKHFVNQMVRAWTRSRGLVADIVRAYNVYGEGQSTTQNKFAPNWINAALKGEDLVIYGNGLQQLDPIYVDDVARVVYRVFTHEKGNGNTFEAGTGVGWNAVDFARLVKRLCESESALRFVPMRAGEDDNAVVVAKKPYLRDCAPLESTLLKTIKYYQNAGEL